MYVLIRHPCWVSVDGRHLRYFYPETYHDLPETLARLLVQRGDGCFLSPSNFNQGRDMPTYPPRILTLVTPAVVQPVTLAEAKLFLRVDGSEEDTLINQLIDSATEAAEAYLRRALITQSWSLEQSYIAGEEINLPFGVIQSITSVATILSNNETVLTTDDYTLGMGNRTLSLKQHHTADRIKIVFQAGYASAEAVPATIKQGVLQQLSALYHQRVEGQGVAREAKALWEAHREVTL